MEDLKSNINLFSGLDNIQAIMNQSFIELSDSDSIITYWINLSELGILELFESYYEKRLTQYKAAHAKDIDVWKRDLRKEFFFYEHITAEEERIDRSMDALPDLSDEDQMRADDIATNYLDFIRKKRRELYPTIYPANRKYEGPFLDAYIRDGVAYNSQDWLETICNLPYPGTPIDMTREQVLEAHHAYYTKILPRQIYEQCKDFDEDLLYYVQDELTDEIDENMKSYPTHESRVHYVKSMLLSFSSFAFPFNPTKEVEESQGYIAQAQQRIKELESIEENAINEKTGEAICPQKKIAEEKEFIKRHEANLENLARAKDAYEKFVWDFSSPIENPHKFFSTIHWSYVLFYRAMHRFGYDLNVICERYGINFSKLQKECGVYIYDSGELNDSANSSLVPHTDKPSKTTVSKNRKKKALAKTIPFTLDYLDKNPSVCKIQQQRISIVYLLWKLWGWIIEESEADDFERFFSGQRIHCNLKWKASNCVLTQLIIKLREQPYIKPQTRCSVNAIIMGQFERKPDHNTKRCTEIDRQRIDLICKLLSLENNPKTLITSFREKEGISEEDLSTLAQYEVLCRNMHVRKSV